ncbi:hypothetical protein AOLI_G00105630 [Acnodon oligacanthus]
MPSRLVMNSDTECQAFLIPVIGGTWGVSSERSYLADKAHEEQINACAVRPVSEAKQKRDTTTQHDCPLG